MKTRRSTAADLLNTGFSRQQAPAATPGCIGESKRFPIEIRSPDRNRSPGARWKKTNSYYLSEQLNKLSAQPKSAGSGPIGQARRFRSERVGQESSERKRRKWPSTRFRPSVARPRWARIRRDGAQGILFS